MGVLQLPRAWSGWGVWDLSQRLRARFVQGEGRMVLGRAGEVLLLLPLPGDSPGSVCW